jgi:hypothetical protein
MAVVKKFCECRFSVSLFHNFINNAFVFQTGENLNIFTTQDIQLMYSAKWVSSGGYMKKERKVSTVNEVSCLLDCEPV